MGAVSSKAIRWVWNHNGHTNKETRVLSQTPGGGGGCGCGGCGPENGIRRSCLSMKRRCMRRVGVAEHMGVRLPASPPPRALDDKELFVIEG